MKAIELSSMWWPLAPHLISFLVLILSPVVSASLKLRDVSEALPGPGIRPGVVVRVTSSSKQLQSDFGTVSGMYWNPMMNEILGKDYVVERMHESGGGACIHAPNDNKGVWCLPLCSLKLYSDTSDHSEVPVASRAFRAVGGPRNVKAEIIPPGRSDMPWDYTVRGAQLMDPIAPPFDKSVDLETSGKPMPSMRKVQTVISVECMEKLHEDPYHPCRPEDFVDHAKVEPCTTTAGPISPTEAEALRKKIRHLQSTIRSLSPKEEKKRKDRPLLKVPGVRDLEHSMTNAIDRSLGKTPVDFDGNKMNIGGMESVQRMRTAQGHGELQGAKELSARSLNKRMTNAEDGKDFHEAVFDGWRSDVKMAR